MTQSNFIFGDCLSVLQKMDRQSVDLVITSPPYNKKKNRRGKIVSSIKYDNYDDDMPENEYQKWQIQVLNELYRVVKDGGSLFYNHKLRWDKGEMIHPITWLKDSAWNLKQEIVWNRKMASNIRGWRFWQVDERIYWLNKPVNGNLIGKELSSRHANLCSVWEIYPRKREFHPAAFPVEIPARIIYSVFDTEREKIILDPFCGIGTVGDAANYFGHNFIGIDISEKYIEFAKAQKNYLKHTAFIEKEIKRHSNKHG